MRQGVITFQIEKSRDIRSEIEPLLAQNWDTVKSRYPKSRLQPNYDFYYGMEDAGILLISTARYDGVLIGYLLVTLIKHPHRSEDSVGCVDTFYVSPGYRSTGVAKNMLRFVEESLKASGVSYLSVFARDKKQERLFGMLGYPKVETVCEKEL